MTAQTGLLLRFKRVHLAAMTVFADEFLHEHMPGMAARLIYRERPLGGLVPVALRTGLPGGLVAVRLRRFPVSGKDEFDKQPVLLDQTELVAVLAHDVPMAGKLPCGIRLLHQMTAVAELRVFLYVVVVPDGQHDAQHRNDEHQGDKNGLVSRAQPPFQFVEYFGDYLIHGN